MVFRSFLLVHGWQGSGPAHWQTWLARRLAAQEEVVYCPEFPSPNSPNLDRWLDTLGHYLSEMEGERIILCHSLGSILWMHYANKYSSDTVERLLLVSPPSPSAIASVPDIQGFLPIPSDPLLIARSAKESLLVCTKGDQYCKEGALLTYGKPFNLETVFLPPEAGHINTESGYGPWPKIEEWCYNSATKIDV